MQKNLILTNYTNGSTTYKLPVFCWVGRGEVVIQHAIKNDILMEYNS